MVLLVIKSHFDSFGEQNRCEDFVFCIDVAFVEYRVKSNRLIRKHAVLMLKNKQNNKSVVHPLTAFIHWKWKYKEYNTQRLQGIHLAQFLNYILIQQRNVYKLNSLSELTKLHGTDFLNYLLIKGNANKSVKNVEGTLQYFYTFLIEKGCLDGFNETKVTFHPMYSREYAYDIDKGRVAIEHTLPPRLILMFLRTAISVSSSIAFAIYLSIFGGLRAGEIVNILISDLTPYGDQYGSGGVLIFLTTRDLRRDIKDISGTSRVKRNRKQFVYSIKGILPTLYKNHLTDMENKFGKAMNLNSPLFLNRNGQALTGKSLRDAFNNVKEKFLSELASSHHPDDMIIALNLKSTKWSFHIGRGTFTNLLAKKARNPYDIALPRGDQSITSSLTYMSDSEEMKKSIEMLINELYEH
ncbi:site-specific integrase [Brevibacillus sp. NPDC058079]|uniref:site-specific integrase n=1 Tax=Brevibacillus sp. NPDC058079 TaxID=3346330 RepID=UPI0036E4E68F